MRFDFVRRFLGLPSGGWPSRTPPTVATGAPSFYCSDCREPVETGARVCPACGREA